MEVTLDGEAIRTERDVHVTLARALDFGPYYGFNLDALWDRLSTDVERPFKITWMNSDVSRQRLGALFDAIVGIFERNRREDQRYPEGKRFNYELR